MGRMQQLDSLGQYGKHMDWCVLTVEDNRGLCLMPGTRGGSASQQKRPALCAKCLPCHDA